jgi:hypothetical protein
VSVAIPNDDKCVIGVLNDQEIRRAAIVNRSREDTKRSCFIYDALKKVHNNDKENRREEIPPDELLFFT